MGCDYYISIILRIYYDDSDYFNIELRRLGGYYSDDIGIDEDDNEYEEKLSEYFKDILTPKMKPIIIYENNNFNKSSSEIKYKKLVEDKIKECNKKWSEITKIIKMETRFER
jgi:hypothetical protein